MQGVGKGGATEATQVVNSPVNTGGAGGLLNQSKDQKESATSTKFGDVFNEIQAKYGAKAEKPREIKKSLGKDDFLRIMITQMKNQDPTNPFKAEQMATEIAQFTSVEQLQNINQNITA
jgi:flagellar basal-body rod modification protein FlgD